MSNKLVTSFIILIFISFSREKISNRKVLKKFLTGLISSSSKSSSSELTLKWSSSSRRMFSSLKRSRSEVLLDLSLMIDRSSSCCCFGWDSIVIHLLIEWKTEQSSINCSLSIFQNRLSQPWSSMFSWITIFSLNEGKKQNITFLSFCNDSEKRRGLEILWIIKKTRNRMKNKVLSKRERREESTIEWEERTMIQVGKLCKIVSKWSLRVWFETPYG